MGFEFGTFVSNLCRHGPTEPKQEKPLSDDWDFYPLRKEDAPASVFVDLGLHENAPLEEFEWLGYIRVAMRQPRSDGLASAGEFGALSALEEDACHRILMTEGIIYVGRNTSRGHRDFFFYCNDEDQFVRAANAAMRRFPEYPCDIGTKPDPEWRTYLDFLYPGPSDMQLIRNRRIGEALEKRGDNLAVARSIDHRSYFDDAHTARAYASWLLSLGFAIIALERGDSASRFFVDFARQDRPDQLDAIALDLFDKAAELGGSYDGWRCEVTRGRHGR